MISADSVAAMQAAGKSQKISLEILTERFRQIDDEGWTLEHDDEHADGQLAKAAGVYALFTAKWSTYSQRSSIPLFWPWLPEWWKPAERRRDLVKAGALIIAEIERLDRLGS